MKKTLLLSILISFGLYGQDYTTGNARSFQDMQIGTVWEEVPVQGSPYYDDVYRVGETLVNHRNVRLLMRYNAYLDQIEMKDKYGKAFNLLKRKDLTATIAGKRYVLLEYKDKNKKVTGYFLPQNNGATVLYWKPKKVFVQAAKPESGYDEFRMPEYADASAFYLSVDGETPEKIQLSKRSVLRNLKGNRSGIKDFILKNNLKLKSAEDVVKLLDFYNTSL